MRRRKIEKIVKDSEEDSKCFWCNKIFKENEMVIRDIYLSDYKGRAKTGFTYLCNGCNKRKHPEDYE